jgi:hypothetical protein
MACELKSRERSFYCISVHLVCIDLIVRIVRMNHHYLFSSSVLSLTSFSCT